MQGWRGAMGRALYGPGGFFVTEGFATGAADGGSGPAGHFRTSVHATGLFAAAVLRLLIRVDDALGHPDPFELVDVGAGRGELLTALTAAAPGHLARRLRPVGVELAARPPELPPAIDWTARLPERVTGLLVATEWLDNVPVDVAEVDADGGVRLLLVDPVTGAEAPGGPVSATDAAWLDRWWPLTGRPPGSRADLGGPRDEAWAAAVSAVDRGCALAVDYGHLRDGRPTGGTLTGYRAGRQVTPVPDGSCDLTAHVAMDAVAAAGGRPYTLLTQRAALHGLGVHGSRPPLDLAGTDPAGYLRALAAASSAGELTDPAGLGGHWWLLHRIGVEVDLTARDTMHP